MHFTDIGRMGPPSPGGKRREAKDLDKAGRPQDSDLGTLGKVYSALLPQLLASSPTPMPFQNMKEGRWLGMGEDGAEVVWEWGEEVTPPCSWALARSPVLKAPSSLPLEGLKHSHPTCEPIPDPPREGKGSPDLPAKIWVGAEGTPKMYCLETWRQKGREGLGAGISDSCPGPWEASRWPPSARPLAMEGHPEAGIWAQ